MTKQKRLDVGCQNWPSGKRLFSSIQILRGMAVLSVIIFHISDMLRQYTDRHGIFCSFASTWHTGAAGVDLFFIISGFVMVQSTRGRFQQDGACREFILRRLIRIVPLYWLCTSLMLIRELLRLTLKKQEFSGLYILKSYFFIPALNPVSGLDLPLLGPGWTLSYEMYFYAVFALFLCLQEKFILPTISTLFLLLTMVGLGQDTLNPILKVLTSPLLLEFVLGCHLAGFVNKKHVSTRTCYLMIAGGLTALLCSQHLNFNIDSRLMRFVTWGIPAFFITAGCVFLEKNESSFIPGKNFLTVLGDSSYSTYLTHTFVVLGLSAMLKRKIVLHVVHNDLLVVGSIIACLLTGYMSYILFEKSISKFLLRIFYRQSQSPGQPLFVELESKLSG